MSTFGQPNSPFGSTPFNPNANAAKRMFGSQPQTSYLSDPTRPELLDFMTGISGAGSRGAKASVADSTGGGTYFGRGLGGIDQMIVGGAMGATGGTPGTSGGQPGQGQGAGQGAPTSTPRMSRVTPQDINAADSETGLILLMGEVDLMEDGPYKKELMGFITRKLRRFEEQRKASEKSEAVAKSKARREEANEKLMYDQWRRFMQDTFPNAVAPEELDLNAFRKFMGGRGYYLFEQWRKTQMSKAKGTPQPGSSDPLDIAELTNKNVKPYNPTDADIATAKRLGLEAPEVIPPTVIPPVAKDTTPPIPPLTGLDFPGSDLDTEKVQAAQKKMEEAAAQERMRRQQRADFAKSPEGQEFEKQVYAAILAVDRSSMTNEGKIYLRQALREGKVHPAEVVAILQQNPKDTKDVPVAIQAVRDARREKIATIRDVETVDAYKEALLSGKITEEEYRQLAGLPPEDMTPTEQADARNYPIPYVRDNSQEFYYPPTGIPAEYNMPEISLANLQRMYQESLRTGSVESGMPFENFVELVRDMHRTGRIGALKTLGVGDVVVLDDGRIVNRNEVPPGVSYRELSQR